MCNAVCGSERVRCVRVCSVGACGAFVLCRVCWSMQIEEADERKTGRKEGRNENEKVDIGGIDPPTSRMRSGRSTI